MSDAPAQLSTRGWIVGPAFIVPDEWIDHNDHMNLARYADAFYVGARQLSDHLEMTEEFKERTRTASFAAELVMSYRREIRTGDEIQVRSQLLGYDRKRVHSWHEVVLTSGDVVAATGEILALNIDRDERRVGDMPAELLERLAALAAAQHALAAPEAQRLRLP